MTKDDLTIYGALLSGLALGPGVALVFGIPGVVVSMNLASLFILCVVIRDTKDSRKHK